MGDFEDAIRLFFKAVPADWEFPCGGATSIAMPEEICLSDAILKLDEESAPEVMRTYSDLEVKDSYELAIFAVRMAVLAVRTRQPDRLRSGVFALILGNKIDWRDRIAATELLKHCAAQLELELGPMVDSFGSLAKEQKDRLTGNGSDSKAAQERALDSCGFVAKGEGAEFRLEHKTPFWTRAELLEKLRKPSS